MRIIYSILVSPDVVAEGLKEMGTSLRELAAQEVDPSLGNGGIRQERRVLHIDSMAHEGMAGTATV